MVELLFPTECLVCGVDGTLCCADCQARLIPQRHSRCLLCERLTLRGRPCAVHRTPLTRVVEAVHLTETVRRLVHGLKYQGMQELVQLFTPLLVAVINRAELPQAVIVPVPLHRWRLNERGYNQAALLVHALAGELNWPTAQLLVRGKKTDPQVGLSGNERRQNLVGAFRYQHGTEAVPSSVLLVDDITTTGSTLIECASVLRNAGVKRVYGAVIARG